MGVRGLTTYINCNQDIFLHFYNHHNSNLVIDGNSLCAQLYRSLNCFSAFGGDYDKFALYTKTFFKNLRKCKITPYVLFDGSYEIRKLKTAYNRLKSKINGASRLDPVTQSSLQIFPLLLRETFKEVLVQMKIMYTVCEFEADDEIAIMARHLDCPVLSYDSDFFIYNVLYIPFNTLEMKPKSIIVNQEKIYAMECKIYRVENLTKNFGGLNEELLPLMATLLGNDFVEKSVFRKFFSQLKLQKSRKKRNEQQRSIHALFKWLQNESLESAIRKILGRLEKSKRKKVCAIINKSINGYQKKHCQSLKYFNISEEITSVAYNIDMPDSIDDNIFIEDEKCSTEEEDTSSDESSEENEDSCLDESNIEEGNVSGLISWFSDGIRCNRIPQTYMNLYTNRLYFCSPQAEDYTDDDSFICSLPILRYAFDILTDFSNSSFVYVSREKDCNYHRMVITEEYSVSRLFDISFNDLSSDHLKKYFYHFLEQKLLLIDFSIIDLLPSNYCLFIISVLWWVAHCNVPISHIHSLIISYIFLEVIDERTGSFRGHMFFNNKHSKKLEELRKRPFIETSIEESLFLNKNKVLYEDCLIAASVLLKHFEIDDSIRKKPKSYNVKKIHSFAQFQCCLQQLNCLNTLCSNPFESIIYSECYNGTFIYNISLKLENQTDPVSFMEEYIKGATTVLMFYKSICYILDKCLNGMNLTTVQWSVRKRKSRRKKNVNKNNDISFIVEGFESNVFI